MKVESVTPAYGFSMASISQVSMAQLYTSALALYGSCFTISGAMYLYEPTSPVIYRAVFGQLMPPRRYFSQTRGGTKTGENAPVSGQNTHALFHVFFHQATKIQKGKE